MAKKQTTKRASRTRRTTRKRASTRAPRATGTHDPRRPAPGTTIKRTFKGKELRLTVLDDGFRFEGTVYRSLTAAALRATGYPAVSGPRFWKTDGHETTPTRGTKRAAKGVAQPVPAMQPATAAEITTA